MSALSAITLEERTMNGHHLSTPTRTTILSWRWLRIILELARTTPTVRTTAARLESEIGSVERAINAGVLRVSAMLSKDHSGCQLANRRGAPPPPNTACLPPASGEEPPRTRPV